MPLSESGYFNVDIMNRLAIATQQKKKYGCCRLKNPKQQSQQMNYICVEKDEAFEVHINTMDQRDKETYGSVLFLDGQRVHGKKTFSGKTVFHGFKLGEGKFKEFTFSQPRFAGMQEEDGHAHYDQGYGQRQRPFPEAGGYHGGHGGGRNKDDEWLDIKYKDAKGTIIIEFFRTEQFERKSRPNQVHTKTYEQHMIDDCNKKSFAETIRIKEGKEFSLPSKQFGGGPPSGNHMGHNKRYPPQFIDQNMNANQYPPQQQGYNKYQDNRRRDQKHDDKRGRTLNMSKANLPGGSLTEDGMIIDYRVDYSTCVDKIIIHYADWSYLQLMQLVDLKNYNHLKLVPKSLMSSNDFITKVLWTVVRENGSVHFSELNNEFQRATGTLLSDHFDFKDDEMRQFVRMKKNVFAIDDKGMTTAREDFDGNTTSHNANDQRRRGQQQQQSGASKSGGVIVID